MLVLIIQNWVILTQIGRRIFPSLGLQCSDESPPQDSPRKKQSPQIRSLFKATGRALREAITVNPDIHGVNSTKGML